jgi:hypothetical protein
VSRIVWNGDACYYQSDAKIWYRVYDGAFRAGKYHRVRPGSSRQPQRYFILKNPAALHRLYVFAPSDNHQVTTELLDAQLAKASYFAGPKRSDADMADWREKIEPDTPEKVAEIRKRNEEKVGEARKRR